MKEPVLEVIGTAKGSVLRIMPEIDFGSIWDEKNKRKVYFSVATEFSNTSYSELNKGDIVEIFVVRTPRGLFAKNLSLKEVRSHQEAEISPGL